MDEVVGVFLERLAGHLTANQDRLVIDSDTHITDLETLSAAQRQRYESTPNYYHGRPISAEELILEMDMAGVDAALTWQNPAATAYSADQDRNAEALLAANLHVLRSSQRYAGRLIPGGWTDPRACGLSNALKIVETCIRDFGFPFLKMNPAQNQYLISSEEVLAVVDRVVELGGIPVFHFGADTKYTPAEGLQLVAERHPDHPLLAVHMGGGGASYHEAESLSHKARALGLTHPNIHYALSAKRDTHMESDLITYQAAGEPFCKNLMCASDAPYGRISWNFGGFRCMFDTLLDGARHTDARLRENPYLFTPEAIQGYLGGNLARLALNGCALRSAAGKTAADLCR